jgi:hypothetical protein
LLGKYAAEFASSVDVILAIASDSLVAEPQASQTIPIVPHARLMSASKGKKLYMDETGHLFIGFAFLGADEERVKTLAPFTES